jgi:transcriptional regulator with XRE-family HTH domain
MPFSSREKPAFVNVGETIRAVRLQNGLSQGDIEKRTGLLRCYQSRVENGHTVPSLDTLAKLATAMGVPLTQLFVDSSSAEKESPPASAADARFMAEIRRHSSNLNESDRKLCLEMVKKLAAAASG